MSDEIKNKIKERLLKAHEAGVEFRSPDELKFYLSKAYEPDYEEEGFTNSFHGWIHGDGEFKELDWDRSHGEDIMDQYSLPHNRENLDAALHWAYNKHEKISIGHGGRLNAIGSKIVLNDPNHPATRTLINKMEEHGLDSISIAHKWYQGYTKYSLKDLKAGGRIQSKNELFEDESGEGTFKSEELKKEMWAFEDDPEELRARAPLHGWISPEGKMNRMKSDELHTTKIRNLANMNHISAHQRGWLSIGGAGLNNVYGDKDVLSDPDHPATKKLISLLKRHGSVWHTDNDGNIEVAARQGWRDEYPKHYIKIKDAIKQGHFGKKEEEDVIKSEEPLIKEMWDLPAAKKIRMRPFHGVITKDGKFHSMKDEQIHWNKFSEITHNHPEYKETHKNWDDFVSLGMQGKPQVKLHNHHLNNEAVLGELSRRASHLEDHIVINFEVPPDNPRSFDFKNYSAKAKDIAAGKFPWQNKEEEVIKAIGGGQFVPKKDFAKWFEGSKVMEGGKPKRVYHGTEQFGFNEFKASTKDNHALGIHFGTKDQAADFVNTKNPKSGTYEAYLNIKNPLRLEDMGGWHPDQVMDQLRNHPTAGFKNKHRKMYEEASKHGYHHQLNAVRDIIKDMGYDGVVYKNRYEGKGRRSYEFDEFEEDDNVLHEDDRRDSYIVFDDSQVHLLPKTAKKVGLIKSEDDLQKSPLIYDAKNNNGKPTTVWRVQDAEGGGPYRGAEAQERFGLRGAGAVMATGDAVNRPIPRFDEGFFANEGESSAFSGKLFGFESPEHAEKWFGKKGLSALSDHGWKLTPVKASKVWSSGKQVYFEPHHEAPKKGLKKSIAEINIDDENVGNIDYSINGNELKIHNMFIEEDYRGQGHIKNKLGEIVKRHGIKKITAPAGWSHEGQAWAAKHQIIEGANVEIGEPTGQFEKSEQDTLTLEHWSSHPFLQDIDPSKHGKGLKGAERERKEAFPESFVDRSYFYSAGTKKEEGLGPFKHTIKVPKESIYDLSTDPAGYFNQTSSSDPYHKRVNETEGKIKAAGYRGAYLGRMGGEHESEAHGHVYMMFGQEKISKSEEFSVKQPISTNVEKAENTENRHNEILSAINNVPKKDRHAAMHGHCANFAHALVRKFGGTMVGLLNHEDEAHAHIVANIDGHYYDASGPANMDISHYINPENKGYEGDLYTNPKHWSWQPHDPESQSGGYDLEDIYVDKEHSDRYLNHLSGSKIKKAATPKYYRADTGYKHDPDQTALDVLNYEESLGNDTKTQALKHFGEDHYASFPAHSLMWVGTNKKSVERYGQPKPVEVGNHKVIADDGEGGKLIFKKGEEEPKFRGWISPKGEYSHLQDHEEHDSWSISDAKRESINNKKYEAGHISIGHGREFNARIHPRLTNDPLHPAIITLRNKIKELPQSEEYNEIEISTGEVSEPDYGCYKVPRNLAEKGMFKRPTQTQLMRKAVMGGNRIGREFHGVITPKGEYHTMEAGELHADKIEQVDTEGAPHTGDSERDHYNRMLFHETAYERGHISVGHGGSNEVMGHKNILENPSHPATRTLVQRIKELDPDINGVNIASIWGQSINDEYDYYPVPRHLAERGIFKKPTKAQQFRKSETSPEDVFHGKHGQYSIISAERSENTPDENRMRMLSLKSDIEQLGYQALPAGGKWGGKQESNFIVPNSNHKAINQLGKKYNQEAVLHSSGKLKELHFTAGENAGKHHKGLDHEEVTEDDNYTEVGGKKYRIKFGDELHEASDMY